MDRTKTGALIAAARKEQNMTQKELAERTGINQADISKLESAISDAETQMDTLKKELKEAEEKAEQQALRDEYREGFKKGLAQHLDRVYYKMPDGSLVKAVQGEVKMPEKKTEDKK